MFLNLVFPGGYLGARSSYFFLTGMYIVPFILKNFPPFILKNFPKKFKFFRHFSPISFIFLPFYHFFFLFSFFLSFFLPFFSFLFPFSPFSSFFLLFPPYNLKTFPNDLKKSPPPPGGGGIRNNIHPCFLNYVLSSLESDNSCRNQKINCAGRIVPWSLYILSLISQFKK